MKAAEKPGGKKGRILNEWIGGGCLIRLTRLKNKARLRKQGGKKSDVPLRRVKQATRERRSAKLLPCSAEIMTHLCICSRLPLCLYFPFLTHLSLKFFFPTLCLSLRLRCFFSSFSTDARLVARPWRRKQRKWSRGWFKSFPGVSVSVDVALTVGLEFVSRPTRHFILSSCCFFFPMQI